MSRMVFRERRSRRQVQLNVTSLVDVLFLLLIFFMLTGTFKRMGEMELKLPESTTSTPAPGAQPHAVELDVRQNGEVTLEGRAVDPADLEERLRAIVAKDPESRITLNADETVPHGRVVHMLDVIRDAGFAGVGFGTTLKTPR